MGENPTGPMGPTEQHAGLHEKVGEWKVECLYFMDPTRDPIEAEGRDRVEALGPFWTTGSFHCNLVGNEITGLATTGYDPIAKKYIGTWQDSSTPFLYCFEGDLDEQGRLVMEGDNVDPMTGQQVRYRSIEEFGDAERRLELHIVVDEDKTHKILEYRYTRL